MRAWTLLLSLLASEALADVRHNAVPVSLQGTWASNAQHCAKPEETVVLATNSYTGPKGRCSVPWVIESAGQHGTVYSMHLRCANDTAGADSGSTLILIPHGADGLSLGDAFDSVTRYERCSAQ